MEDMLEATTELNNSVVSNANFTQEIAINQNDVTISWQPFANGLSNQQDNVILEFQNGNLVMYSGLLSVYTIGKTAVNISEQSAIQIATENAEACSYQIDNETISNVTILDNQAIANLTLQNRGNATLYPLWNILLPLDRLYPGGVTSFRVLIWADTGDVSSITPVGSYGVGTDPSATPNTPSTQSTTDSIAVIIAAVAATIAVSSYLFYKRKR